MIYKEIHALMTNPVLLNRDTLSDLDTLVKIYPYFQTGRILHLKNLQTVNDTRFSQELRTTALYVGDRSRLFHYIEGEPLKPGKEVSVVENTVDLAGRTVALIDAFLSGKEDIPDRIEEEIDHPLAAADISLPKKMLASYDYLSFLLSSHEKDEKTEQTEQIESANEDVRLRHQELIDNFISENEEGGKIHIKAHPEIDDIKNPVNQRDKEEKEEFFSETLAKIYVKQKRYEKGLDIIRKLYLKYPEKNIYFADQIRFLELLIANTKTL
ncbi:MAG: tetratricopeptide repeat protein [Candidatus Azobacteroides sp.]|nr:tetratricopeptide repeat protein [Candidatus Azobacteroides sp.]